MIIVQAASRDVRRFCVTLRTLMRCGCGAGVWMVQTESGEYCCASAARLLYMNDSYPRRIDALDEGTCPLHRFHRHLQHTVHVHMIALHLMAARRIRVIPANQYALIQLSLQRQVTRCGHYARCGRGCVDEWERTEHIIVRGHIYCLRLSLLVCFRGYRSYPT